MVYYALFHWLATCVADALRHAADYDPAAHFSKNDVREYLGMASNILETVQTATPADKRALAIHVLFKERPASP